ncbi:RHS repeat-associated core domain-containing protein [Flexivirga sp.]|uniref:RHS repeat-associated core domain-containing protein n=1 Tax=Flexivirga sp. TaxID=1962927 RepID=UPI002D7EA5DF|nr:ribonuclease domain-containing protein [Flexivirga sp.]
MPVTLANKSGASGLQLGVEVLGQDTARAAGVHGVVVRVTPQSTAAQSTAAGSPSTVWPEGKTARGSRVTVGMDYGFLKSAQAQLGQRLRWVRLPACALTTPDKPACQVQTPLVSHHSGAHTVTTTVDPAAATPKVSVSKASAKSADPGLAAGAAPAVVLAAVAGSSGSNGDFTATPLKPSGSWSAGDGTGQFNWSYPLVLPHAGIGDDVAPDVTFGYDSSLVDGQIAGQNDQSSWVGEGWGYSPGSVQRTYRTCSDDTSLPTASKTSDLCWAGQILTLSLGGRSNAIVRDDTTGTYRLQDDDGSKVQHLTGASNGAQDGEYWVVTDTDGVKYFFGRNVLPGGDSSNATNSVNTVPVYGAKDGDPCYKSTGFADSRCDQAWQWNLDMVQDTHDNVTTYTYTKESNYYGANKGTAPVKYTRASYPATIQYGQRLAGGSVYGTPAADQVVFHSGERCIPSSTFTCAAADFTAANALNWPDTPQDQVCASSGTCNVHAPTFWTQKRLTSVDTQYRSGSSYATADTYTLTQSFATTGDAQMSLDSIVRTGKAGGSTALPAVTFGYDEYNNRIEDLNSQPQMMRKRMTYIGTETGESISVSYNTDPGQSGRAPAQCTASTLPANLALNTTECFPVKWTPLGYSAPITDYFHTYVATQVTTSATSEPMPNRTTTYTYTGGGAWHYDNDETVKPANRTYGQWRGYAAVETRSGDSDGWTLTKDSFFRGMDGNKQPTGTQSVHVTDSAGVQHTDSDAFSGTTLEEQVFNGTTRVSSQITVPQIVTTTATRARSGIADLTATVTGDKQTKEITARASGDDLWLQHDYTYNDLGLVTSDSETGSDVPALCTTTAYATDTSSGISAPSEIISSGQACPSGTTPQTSVLSVDRNYYDGSGTLGTVTGAGDVTRTDSATKSATTFSTATSTYDAAGRVTASTVHASATDTTGRTTTTAYTPATGGPVTGVTVTNPLGQTTTQTTDPAHGTVTKAVDVAGHATTATYDALGRITGVWEPGQTQGSTPATTTFAYKVSTTSPSAITTNTLVDPGTGTTSTVKSVQIFDSYGEIQQTQTAAAGGGAMVSDTGFDAHGWATSANNHYYIGSAPSTTVFMPTGYGNINNRTTTNYDLAGRPTKTTLYNGDTLTSSTTSVYGGDRVTTLPPTGGVATTQISDARGNTIETDRWSTRPTITGNTYSGGTAVKTTYGFDAAGRQTAMATAVGTAKEQSWSTTFDLAGNATKQVDPESGTSTATFNDLGEQLTSTDARGKTIATTYDLLGRQTAQYAGSTSGTKLTGFTYDSLQKGQPTASTRYVGGAAYTTAATGYDSAGRPKGTKVSFTKTGFAASYTSSNTYTSTGLLKTTTLPAAGTQAAETLTYTYDAQGNSNTLKGTKTYVAGMQYDRDGTPVRFQLNDSPTAYLLDDLDGQTRAVRGRTLSIGLAIQDDVDNTYDKAGNLTKTVNTQGAAGSPTETTCYSYDGLDQLTQAWTATDACATDPASNAGAKVGGPQPYWQSWTFDAAGNRTSQVAHKLPSTATPLSGANPLSPKTASNTTTYSYGDADHPNAMTSATTTGPNPSTRSQTLDAAGNVTARHTPSGDQTITYDDQGFTTSIKTGKGTTTYVNDADGNELLKTDANGATTLYLGGEDVTVTGTGTSAAVSKVIRYYSMAGRQVAYRSNGAAPVFESLNTQDSLIAKWNPTAAAGKQVSRLYLDPYGNNLLAGGDGTLLAAGQVADGRGFLNQTSSNDTGIVDTGVRKYDPTTGAFLSVDPLLDASNPMQWNGYAYGGANPVSNADPTGAMFPKGGGPVLTPRGGGGHHSGGRRKPAPRSTVRKAPPNYAPGAWWGQGGSAYRAPRHYAYRAPRHYVDPRARWGVPAQHAGGMYAKPKSYQQKVSATRPTGGVVVGNCGGWAQANGMCRDQQRAIRDGIRANFTETEFWFMAASYPLMPLEGAGEAFSAFRAARVATRAAEDAGSKVAFGPGLEKAWSVLDRVDAKGSPLPGYKGGRAFGNTQGRLPESPGVAYREWDVNPYVKGVNRGAERIVTGDDGSAYWTGDHYDTFLMFRGPTQ